MAVRMYLQAYLPVTGSDPAFKVFGFVAMNYEVGILTLALIVNSLIIYYFIGSDMTVSMGNFRTFLSIASMSLGIVCSS